jgi:hypothetical protein
MREQAYRCDIEKACLKRLSTICCKMLKTLIYKLFTQKLPPQKRIFAILFSIARYGSKQRRINTAGR